MHDIFFALIRKPIIEPTKQNKQVTSDNECQWESARLLAVPPSERVGKAKVKTRLKLSRTTLSFAMLTREHTCSRARGHTERKFLGENWSFPTCFPSPAVDGSCCLQSLRPPGKPATSPTHAHQLTPLTDSRTQAHTRTHPHGQFGA